jgi:apolipoprotein N-acyltransferase
LIAFTLAVIAALLYAGLFPPFGLGWLAWVALVPLIRACDEAGGAKSFLLAGSFGLLTTLFIVPWLAPTARDYFEQSSITTLLLVGTVGAASIAPYFAISFGLLGALQRRVPRIVWLLLIPAAWVTAEWLRSNLGLRSSWCLLGTSLIEAPRLRQLADITGVYGVSGLIVLGNAVVAEALRVAEQGLAERRLPSTGRLRPLLECAALFGIVLVLALIHGDRKLAEPSRGATFDVAIVQGNVAQQLRWRRGEAMRVLSRYSGLSESIMNSADEPPDLIVWPESALQKPVEHPLYGPPLRRLVEKLGAPVLVGAPRTSEAGHHNSASLMLPQGGIRYYDKMRLLPFSETHPIDRLRSLPARGDDHLRGYIAGARPGLFDWNRGRLGVLICFEAIYPSLSRDLALQGAGAIVNLSNDGWYRGSGGPEQHLEQVVFRAIETGLPLIRSTTTGISAVISPSGEVVARLGEGERGILRVSVPAPRLRPTLYVQYGDVYAMGSALLLCMTAAFALVRNRRRRVEESWLEEPLAPTNL